MLEARKSGRPSISRPIIANCPLRNRKPELRVAVKLKSVSVQCRTERTFSRWKALMSFGFSACCNVEGLRVAEAANRQNPRNTRGFCRDFRPDVRQYRR